MQRLQQALQGRLHFPCDRLRSERQASERFGNDAADGRVIIFRESIEQRSRDERRLRC